MRIIVFFLLFCIALSSIKAQMLSISEKSSVYALCEPNGNTPDTTQTFTAVASTTYFGHRAGFDGIIPLTNIADSVLPITKTPATRANISLPILPYLDSLNLSKGEKAFTISSSILSVSLMALGAASHYVPELMNINTQIRDKVQTWRYEGPMQGQVMNIDAVLQYTPLATTYLLNACGKHGRHSYLDLALITAESHIAKGIVILAVKEWTSLRRPDLSAYNTFPSGHTSTAFAGAEILRLEYQEMSPWIGVAGYAIAIGTGLLRVYNNRHWAGDVLAGAGVGILSARFAYWINPKIRKLLIRKKHTPITSSTSILDPTPLP